MSQPAEDAPVVPLATERTEIPQFRWQIPQKLAGVSFPQTTAVLALLKDKCIRAFVSLSEMPIPPDQLASLGLQAVHVPVADFSAPTIEQIEQAVGAINRFLEQGSPVAVHCGAGLGRTGMILACYLVWLGMSSTDALTQVRQMQPGSVETRAQEARIAEYERHLRGIS